MIPGLTSTHHREYHRDHFRRGQLLERMYLGKPISAELEVPTNDTTNAKTVKFSEPRAPTALAFKNTGQSQSSAFREDPSQPAWITHDRQVLRFFGYFLDRELKDKDTFADARTLNSKQPTDKMEAVRRVVVCFHLSDRSIEISEPRVANSGRVQGAFLKRTVLSKTPTGPQSRPELFSPTDFRVGGELRVCGRTIHLVDCDEATRAFYRDTDELQTIESPRKYPDDSPDTAAEEVAAIRERLRAKERAQSESAAEKARKFRELSGKVLRFSAVWKDPHPLYPQSHPLVLLYYLCDDTLEMLELQPRPSTFQISSADISGGNARSRVLLSRRRIALERPGVPDRKGNDMVATRFISARDLRCGEWLRIFSRDIFLEDCDPFTRSYYLEAFGVTQERFSIDNAPQSSAEVLTNNKDQPPKAAKWTLFQSKQTAEPDTRSYHLRHDGGTSMNQRDTLDGRQLRFRARFHGLARDDPNTDRQFVLTYFLEDDTLAVFEPGKQSAGGKTGGGRFLDRGRFRKSARADLGGTTTREHQKERSTYKAEDFYVGAIICFEFSPNQRLELLEADAQTLAWCEAHPEHFPFSDLNAVLDMLASSTTRRNGSVGLLTSFQSFDKNDAHPGTISIREAHGVLASFGLNQHQALTLCRRFTADGTNVTSVTAPAITSRSNKGKDNAQGHQLTQNEPRVRYRSLSDAVSARVTRSNPTDKNKNARQPENTPVGLLGKLQRVPNLQQFLSRRDRESSIPMSQFFEVTATAHVELDARDVQELVAIGCVRNGRIDIDKLGAYIQEAGGATSHRQPEVLNTARTYEDALEDEAWWSPDGGDQSEPPPQTWASPRHPVSMQLRHPSSGRKIDSTYDKPATVPPIQLNSMPNHLIPANVSPRRLQQSPVVQDSLRRVAALVQRVFGTRKYQLRRAFRDRDREKSGCLAEDEFMDAVLSVEPTLSDDDTYLIADAYFPTNNCTVDYSELLEHAFRAS